MEPFSYLLVGVGAYSLVLELFLVQFQIVALLFVVVLDQYQIIAYLLLDVVAVALIA